MNIENGDRFIGKEMDGKDSEPLDLFPTKRNKITSKLNTSH